ncbi:MAG TPA: hypothetical protein VJP88_08675 [Caulobacteraceae bacterium]|nr:hypothetical protein [Caulobacteraceae bacterium]
MTTLNPADLADQAQYAFETACPDGASPYDIGKAWQKVGEHLAAVLAEAHAEHGCAFFDCVNEPGCEPGDPNCPAIRAALEQGS